MKHLQPYDYQATSIAFGVCNDRALILGDPGVGKTLISLATFRALKRLGLANRAIVFATKRVANQVWAQEAEEWDAFGDLVVVVATGAETKRIKALESDADVYVLSTDLAGWFKDLLAGKRRTEAAKKFRDLQHQVETVIGEGPSKEWDKLRAKWRTAKRLRDQLKAFKPPAGLDLLIVDEIGKFRNSNSARSRAMLSIAQKFERRIGLTGTLYPKTLESLHNVYRILDDGQRLGKTKKSFRERWFSEEVKHVGAGQTYSEWHPLPGAVESIAEAVADITIRLDANDLLDMPPLVEVVHNVEMTPKGRKVYDQMEEKLFAEVDGVEVFTESASGKYRACKQILNGGIYGEDSFDLFQDERDVHEIHDAKGELVEELVDTLEGRPLFVLYEFRHDLPRLRKRLGDDLPALNGDTTEEDAGRIIKAWNAGEYPVLAAQWAAVSHGLNLQKGGCRDVFAFGLPDDFDLWDQAIRRVYRQGVDGKVRVHIPITSGTIEGKLLSALQMKEAAQSNLYQIFKDLRKGK